jgi:hypothetical protein
MPNDLNTNLALFLNGLGATPSGSVMVRLSTQATVGGVANVSTSETDLYTYTMPANALNANNQSVRVTCWGNFAANGNTKAVNVYLGSSVIASMAGLTDSGTSWTVQTLAIRTGAATQNRMAVNTHGGTVTTQTGTGNQDTTAAIIIKVTGTSATGSGDVTAFGMVVEWLP